MNHSSREIRHPNDYSPTTSDYYMPQASANSKLRIENSKLHTLFLQNEPNFKTTQNDVSHFQKANCLKLKAKSCRKNKANQTQFPNVVPASSRQLFAPQASSLTHQGYKKIPNKPNFQTTQNAVSPFPTTVYCILSPVYWKKNKPKRTQFHEPGKIQDLKCPVKIRTNFTLFHKKVEYFFVFAVNFLTKMGQICNLYPLPVA